MLSKNSCRAFVLAGSLTCGLFAHSSHAATVNGSYQGTIDSDSGLGFIGQLMHVDFSYDDSLVGVLDFGVYSFDSFLQSMTIRISTHTWHWRSATGYSLMTLRDDDVVVFSIGVEDRINAFAETFDGPDVVAEPVDPGAYFFQLYLSDNEPIGTPDGLTDASVLPPVAPDPALFSGPGNRTMVFSFHTGDVESGDHYLISTADVTPGTPIPVPAAAWLLVTGLAGLSVRRGRHTR